MVGIVGCGRCGGRHNPGPCGPAFEGAEQGLPLESSGDPTIVPSNLPLDTVFHGGDLNKTYLTITGDGHIIIGPDLTYDEAAAGFLAALRALGVEVSTNEPNEHT